MSSIFLSFLSNVRLTFIRVRADIIRSTQPFPSTPNTTLSNI